MAGVAAGWAFRVVPSHAQWMAAVTYPGPVPYTVRFGLVYVERLASPSTPPSTVRYGHIVCCTVVVYCVRSYSLDYYRLCCELDTHYSTPANQVCQEEGSG